MGATTKCWWYDEWFGIYDIILDYSEWNIPMSSSKWKKDLRKNHEDAGKAEETLTNILKLTLCVTVVLVIIVS